MEASRFACWAHRRSRSDAFPAQLLCSPIIGTYTGGQRVGLDDALDGRPSVCHIGASESAGRPERRFTRGGPERKIRHARQCLELHVIDGPEAMHCPVKEGAEDKWGARFRICAKAPPDAGSRLA